MQVCLNNFIFPCNSEIDEPYWQIERRCVLMTLDNWCKLKNNKILHLSKVFSLNSYKCRVILDPLIEYINIFSFTYVTATTNVHLSDEKIE